MKTTCDIAWPGGKARAGETIDTSTIPPLTLARWETAGVIIADDVTDDGLGYDRWIGRNIDTEEELAEDG